MILEINNYLKSSTASSKLAVFRICFGVMMLYSMLRFWSKGWIDSIYISPKFHFKYYGFEWVQSLGEYTYLLFAVCILCAVLITIGLWYRLGMILFFLSFSYIELIEKTTYLNHYYFISILSFLLVFLPANKCFSIDALLRKKQYKEIPQWTVDAIKLLMVIVYFYAGLAKLNSDWLLKALPLKIWMPSKYDIPIIGETLLQQEWVHYAMSWGGMFYDLIIPFLLLYRKTRFFGFLMVVFFHVFTAILFPIGMFPYIMIVSALVFFEGNTHDKIIRFLNKIIKPIGSLWGTVTYDYVSQYHYKRLRGAQLILCTFFIAQLALPFRYVLYPSELFWAEEGYRFSWRVMLVEKIGYTNFKVVNKTTGDSFLVRNGHFLTDLQIKQMSFQPDMILEYAHYLGDHFKNQGHRNIGIYAESFVSLNGRSNQQFIDPEVDLLLEEESFKHKQWIKPFKDEIKGF